MKKKQDDQNDIHIQAARHLWRLERLEYMVEQNRDFLTALSVGQQLIASIQQYRKWYMAYNKYTPSSEILAAQAPKGNISTAKTGRAPLEKDIESSPFINAVYEWRVSMEEFFEKSTIDYAKVNIDIPLFTQNITKHQSLLPIVADLYQEWGNLLNTLPNSLTAEELFTTLLNNQGGTWLLTSDMSALEKHYKSKRKAYKKYESTMKAFRDEAMPKQQYFMNALLTSSSKDDPNRPENLAEAKKRLEEAKKRLEEEAQYDFRQVEADYKAWLNETLKELEKVDSTEQGAIIDLRLLQKNKDSALDGPNYADVFWKSVGDKALKKIQAIGGDISYLQAKELVEDALTSTYKQTIDDDFLKMVVTSKDSEMPRGLKSWLKISTNDRKGLQGEFAEAYLIWTNEISKVVALCENQNKGHTFTVDVAQFQQELVVRFSYTVNGVQPGEQLMELLSSALPQTQTTDFSTLLQYWKDGVTTLQDSGLIDLFWEEYLAREAGGRPMKEMVSNFISKLPSKESLVNALLDARYGNIKPKLVQYGRSEAVITTVAIRWNPVRLLMGTAAAQIVEQLGLDSLANLISKSVGGSEVQLTEGGEVILARLTDSVEFDVRLPMHLVKGAAGEIRAVPSSLSTDSIKFNGSGDGHYKVNVLRVYTETDKPRSAVANTYYQRLVIATTVEDPEISIAISASMLVGTEVTMTKNARVCSVDFVLDIESVYNPAENSYNISFRTPAEVRDQGAIIEGVDITPFASLELDVFEK